MSSFHLPCPPLTDEERAVCCKFCHKCRRLFVDHKSHNCPHGYPDGHTYKPLTKELGLKLTTRRAIASTYTSREIVHAPCSEGSLHTSSFSSSVNTSYMPKPNLPNAVDTSFHNVTNMTSVPASPPTILPSSFIERCVTPAPESQTSSLPATTVGVTLPSQPVLFALGNGSDTEDENLSDVSAPPCPVSIPHLVWKANIIGNDDFPVPVDCLLDSGAHLVLIRPEVVADLFACPFRNLSTRYL